MFHGGFVLAALGAAFAFAVATHVKHLSATDLPAPAGPRLSALGRFIRATVSHRLWLYGLVADTAGLVLQLVALHLGPLAAVQPLLIFSLLFALLLRQRHNARSRFNETIWALVVIGALAGLLALAQASNPASGAADRGPAISAAAAALTLAGASLLGRHQRAATRTAIRLGIAVGALYATTAALLKALTDIAVRHPIAIAWSWQLYVVIVLGAAGLVLNQLAFQAGPLTASLPAISIVDPLLSIVVGVWVFDEHLRHGVLTDIGFGGLLVVLSVAVIQLARAAADLDPPPWTDRHAVPTTRQGR